MIGLQIYKLIIVTKSYREFFLVNGLSVIIVSINFVGYCLSKSYKQTIKHFGIISQVFYCILATEITLGSITLISDIDSEPFFIAVLASLSFLHYNSRNLFVSMAICYVYFCLRILIRIGGDDSTFRLVRICIFNGIAFIYIFFFTRSYIQRERENFMKHYN